MWTKERGFMDCVVITRLCSRHNFHTFVEDDAGNGKS